MLRLGTFSSWLVVAVAVGLPGPVRTTDAAKGSSVSAPQESKAEKGVATVIRNLAQPYTLEQDMGVSTPLRDALDFIEGKYGLRIVLNSMAFQKHGIESVEDQPVRLRKLINVPLSEVLRRLLEQVQGAYLVRGDHVEVTSVWATRPERFFEFEDGWPRTIEPERLYLPLVHVVFNKRDLEGSLRELSEATDFSIVIDGRVGDSANTAVTASLINVPLDTAVRLLADMSGLDLVLMKNVLYVTTKPNAARWRAEQAEERRSRLDQPKEDKPQASSPSK
jgi:hypothetical protein